MRLLLASACIVATLAPASSLRAQAVLRPGPSGRATTEVSLSYPRPATPMTGMAGMPATATATPTPAPATADTTFTIRLDYGQPQLRGRMLHTDSLVPYDKPWRTGANRTTTLTSEVDLVIGGMPVAKGSYVVFTVPSRSGWKLILQRPVGQSAMDYDPKNDVTQIDLRYSALPMPIESLTMWLIPSLAPGAAKGELRFAWGTDQLSTDWSVR